MCELYTAEKPSEIAFIIVDYKYYHCCCQKKGVKKIPAVEEKLARIQLTGEISLLTNFQVLVSNDSFILVYGLNREY